MAECGKKDTCKNYDKKCSQCWANSSIYDTHPCYTSKDLVEVVRCKDCKHATFYSCKNDACYKAIICEYKIGIGDENFYCACAEPRTPKERGLMVE